MQFSRFNQQIKALFLYNVQVSDFFFILDPCLFAISLNATVIKGDYLALESIHSSTVTSLI